MVWAAMETDAASLDDLASYDEISLEDEDLEELLADEEDYTEITYDSDDEGDPIATGPSQSIMTGKNVVFTNEKTKAAEEEAYRNDEVALLTRELLEQRKKELEELEERLAKEREEEKELKSKLEEEKAQMLREEEDRKARLREQEEERRNQEEMSRLNHEKEEQHKRLEELKAMKEAEEAEARLIQERLEAEKSVEEERLRRLAAEEELQRAEAEKKEMEEEIRKMELALLEAKQAKEAALQRAAEEKTRLKEKVESKKKAILEADFNKEKMKSEDEKSSTYEGAMAVAEENGDGDHLPEQELHPEEQPVSVAGDSNVRESNRPPVEEEKAPENFATDFQRETNDEGAGDTLDGTAAPHSTGITVVEAPPINVTKEKESSSNEQANAKEDTTVPHIDATRLDKKDEELEELKRQEQELRKRLEEKTKRQPMKRTKSTRDALSRIDALKAEEERLRAQLEKKKTRPKEEVTTNADQNAKYYPLEAIRKKSIPGLDYTKREQYLSPEDFFSVFECTKEDFAKWPKWKQKKVKLNVRLF